MSMRWYKVYANQLLLLVDYFTHVIRCTRKINEQTMWRKNMRVTVFALLVAAV